MDIVDKKKYKSDTLQVKKCNFCKKEFGSYRDTRKYCSKKCSDIGVGLRIRKGEYRICERCGKSFWSRPSDDRKGVVRRYCSYKCYHPCENGKSVSYDGYYVFNYKKVHRTLMEEHIGRKLLSSEIVHHINGDKLDNRIDNLKIVTRSEHNKIHRFLCKRVRGLL